MVARTRWQAHIKKKNFLKVDTKVIDILKAKNYLNVDLAYALIVLSINKLNKVFLISILHSN